MHGILATLVQHWIMSSFSLFKKAVSIFQRLAIV